MDEEEESFCGLVGEEVEEEKQIVLLIDFQKLVTKTVKCEQREVLGLIDSGASISVMSPEIKEKWGVVTKPWPGKPVRMANGATVMPEGKAWVTIEDEGRQATGWVTVMELSKGIQLLIGTDMIRKFGS